MWLQILAFIAILGMGVSYLFPSQSSSTTQIGGMIKKLNKLSHNYRKIKK
jgi:hypothetical protein